MATRPESTTVALLGMLEEKKLITTFERTQISDFWGKVSLDHSLTDKVGPFYASIDRAFGNLQSATRPTLETRAQEIQRLIVTEQASLMQGQPQQLIVPLPMPTARATAPAPNAGASYLPSSYLQTSRAPNILDELVEKTEPLDRNKDPNIFFNQTATQKIVEPEIERAEGDHSLRVMRQSVAAQGAEGGEVATHDADWHEANIIDYPALQVCYSHIKKKTGLVPSPRAMQLLSKSVQAHIVNLLSASIQQTHRRTSQATVEEFVQMYVLTGENPALKSSFYSMKWGPDPLTKLRADESVLIAAYNAGAAQNLVKVQEAVSASAAVKAAAAEAAATQPTSNKRKAAELEVPGSQTYLDREAIEEKNGRLTVEQIALLIFSEEQKQQVSVIKTATDPVIKTATDQAKQEPPKQPELPPYDPSDPETNRKRLLMMAKTECPILRKIAPEPYQLVLLDDVKAVLEDHAKWQWL